ncbi:MAG TPA: hypothetical protein VFL91_08460 [Thermomicrobiales bacterium]|nr:hypothetical protein [Thermomicrobiales bacterium]
MPARTTPRRPRVLRVERDHAEHWRRRARASHTFEPDPWDPVACWYFAERLRRHRLPPWIAHVLFLLASGVTNQEEIAGYLGVAARQVDNALWQSRKRLEARTTAQLVVLLWSDYEAARRRAEKGRPQVREDDLRAGWREREDKSGRYKRRVAQPDRQDRVG